MSILIIIFKKYSSCKVYPLKLIYQFIQQIPVNHSKIDTKLNWLQIETKDCNKIRLVYIKDVDPAMPYNKVQNFSKNAQI